MEPILTINKTPSGFDITISARGTKADVLKDLVHLLPAMDTVKQNLLKNIKNNLKEMQTEMGHSCNDECKTCTESDCPMQSINKAIDGEKEVEKKNSEFAEISEQVMKLNPEEMDQLIKDFKGLLKRR